MEANGPESQRIFTATVGSLCDIFKQQQDYYKTFTALNATTLLITIAFADKFIRAPNSMPLIMIPFAFFTLSLLSSLYMMKIFGDLYAYVMGFYQSALVLTNAGEKDIQKFKDEAESLRQRLVSLGTKVSKLQGPALWLYFGGILTLIIFAIISLVPAKWPYFLGILLLIILISIFLLKLRSKKTESKTEATGPGPAAAGPIVS